MRRTASEVIRDLEIRVAHLENKQAGKSKEEQIEEFQVQLTELESVEMHVRTIARLLGELKDMEKAITDADAKKTIKNVMKGNVRGAEAAIKNSRNKVLSAMNELYMR